MNYRLAYKPDYYKNTSYTSFKLFIYLRLVTNKYL
jgi:hypothetical protein